MNHNTIKTKRIFLIRLGMCLFLSLVIHGLVLKWIFSMKEAWILGSEVPSQQSIQVGLLYQQIPKKTLQKELNQPVFQQETLHQNHPNASKQPRQHQMEVSPSPRSTSERLPATSTLLNHYIDWIHQLLSTQLTNKLRDVSAAKGLAFSLDIELTLDGEITDLSMHWPEPSYTQRSSLKRQVWMQIRSLEVLPSILQLSEIKNLSEQPVSQMLQQLPSTLSLNIPIILRK